MCSQVENLWAGVGLLRHLYTSPGDWQKIHSAFSISYKLQVCTLLVVVLGPHFQEQRLLDNHAMSFTLFILRVPCFIYLRGSLPGTAAGECDWEPRPDFSSEVL